MEKTRFIPITEWSKHHPWPTTSGLRLIRARQEENGFKKAFVKIGGKVLVDEKAFFECLEQQNRNK